jgi:hypothetical protein
MRRLFKIVCSLAALVLLISTANAQQAGQDLHADDIQPWRVGAEIFVNSTLFEADFGDLSGGPFVTDEPGVDVNVQAGAFTPSNWLRFQPVGQLLYWDGTQWSEVVPNDERIEITDALNNAIPFNANSVSDIAGVIGEIDNNGGLHAHISFNIFDASNTPNGSAGAYRIQFKLFESLPQSDTSVSIATSPITIVFNRGLETENYELAVSSSADLDNSPVFVAETGLLTIHRVNALGSVYKVKMQYIGNNQFQLIEADEIINVR